MSRMASVNTQPAGVVDAPRHPAVAAANSRLGRLAGALALALLGVWVCLPAWSDIATIAMRDEEASHILLVPFIAAWLLAARREELPSIPLGPSLLGPAVIALGGLLNAYGFYFFKQVFWHGGALLVALGCFMSVAGWRVVWRLLPVFALGLFVVPVPAMIRQEIALPLQQATATATAWAYELFAYPIEQSGSVLRLNGVDVAVAEACNGMRMVFALVLVTYAVAFAAPLKPGVRALLLLASPLLAIVCNVMRLIPTVWIYGYYPEEVAATFHDLSGWAMIVLAFFMVMGILSLLQWLEIPVMKGTAEGDA